MTKSPRSLTAIFIFGLVLRLLFIISSNHVFHPDEIFQSLEISHRLVFGSGLIAWDYAYGLRSFALPLLFSLPLFLLKSVGLTQPEVYTTVIKIILALASTVLIPAAYHLTRLTSNNQKLALLSAFIMAVWYELIYLAPRALTETLATYVIAAAFLLITAPKPKPFLSGICLTAALLLRLQYAPIIVVAVWFARSRLAPYPKALITGAIVTVVMFGLVDYWSYGTFLSHPSTNLKVSLLSGISGEFGIQPWWYYLVAFASTSIGLIIFLFRRRHPLDTKLLSLIVLGVTIHSIIAHKEYRFTFIVIPLYLIYIAPALYRLAKNRAYFIVLLLSLIGFMRLSPWQNRFYLHPMFFKDPVLSIALPSNAPRCSLYLPDRDWAYTGGSFHLHVNQLYSNRYKPQASNPQYILQTTAFPGPSGYQPHSFQDNYTLFKSDTVTCDQPPIAASVRSFNYLGPYLKNTPIALKWLK